MFDQLYIYNSDSRGVPIHGRREQHVCLPADNICFASISLLKALAGIVLNDVGAHPRCHQTSLTYAQALHLIFHLTCWLLLFREQEQAGR